MCFRESINFSYITNTSERCFTYKMQILKSNLYICIQFLQRSRNPGKNLCAQTALITLQITSKQFLDLSLLKRGYPNKTIQKHSIQFFSIKVGVLHGNFYTEIINCTFNIESSTFILKLGILQVYPFVEINLSHALNRESKIPEDKIKQL